MERELRSLGAASQRWAKELIRRGRVTVDGAKIRDPKADLAAESEVAVDGLLVDRNPPLLLKYHKPLNVVCSMKDEKGRKDLTSALPGLVAPWAEEAPPLRRGAALAAGPLEPWVAVTEYHPVGRLDQDTSGLLLLSRDGQLTQRLLNPAREVPRIYVAVVEGNVAKADADGLGVAQKLQQGVRTSDGIFPADVHELEPLGGGARSRVVLQVREGKYRMVRKMLYNCGFPVLELHRISYGAVELAGLEEGHLGRPSEVEAHWAEVVRHPGAEARMAAAAPGGSEPAPRAASRSYND